MSYHKSVKNKRPDLLRILALLTCFLMIVYFWLFAFMPKKIPHSLRFLVPAKKTNILVMGLDYSYDENNRRVNSFRTDTLILACFDPFDDKIKILSIPRDSIVEIPGFGLGRINKAYAIGKEDLAKQTASGLLGINIDGFVAMVPSGLSDIVDSLGGIKVRVEQNMRYTDNWGHLKINLKKGEQKLDGKQAEGYVRFRGDNLGDIGRIKRQQNFLKALFYKLASPSALVRFPFVLNAVKRSFSTDIPFYEFIKIGNLARMADKEDIIMKMLPGSSPGEGESRGAWVINKMEKDILLRDINIR